VIFWLEFFVKFIALKITYFCDGWNMFDFFLLLLSVFGLVMEFATAGLDSGNDASNEARLFRLNRLFRVLRVLRLFRLFKFFLVLKAKFQNETISFQLAERMKSITILRAFARAHANSQLELVRYFGNNGKPESVEQMRCILGSQTEVYRALVVAA